MNNKFMQIRFIRDVFGIYNVSFPKGTIKNYYPWNFLWQGMTEPERVAKGIFVECHGHGEFDVFRETDVEVISEKMNDKICMRSIVAYSDKEKSYIIHCDILHKENKPHYICSVKIDSPEDKEIIKECQEDAIGLLFIQLDKNEYKISDFRDDYFNTFDDYLEELGVLLYLEYTTYTKDNFDKMGLLTVKENEEYKKQIKQIKRNTNE